MPFARILTASLLASLAPLLGVSALGAALGLPVHGSAPSETYSLVDLLRSAAQLETAKPGKTEAQLQAKKDKLKIHPSPRRLQLTQEQPFSPATYRAMAQAQQHGFAVAYHARPLVDAPADHLAPLRC